MGGYLAGLSTAALLPPPTKSPDYWWLTLVQGICLACMGIILISGKPLIKSENEKT